MVFNPARKAYFNGNEKVYVHQISLKIESKSSYGVLIETEDGKLLRVPLNTIQMMNKPKES